MLSSIIGVFDFIKECLCFVIRKECERETGGERDNTEIDRENTNPCFMTGYIEDGFPFPLYIYN